jgi:hypothetical protein
MMKVTGTRQLQSRLRAVQKAPPTLIRTIALSAVRYQKQLVPRKTGNLGRSIHLVRVTRSSATTEAKAPYAAAVEFGTKPHIIRPRRAAVLAFPAAGTARRLSGKARKGGAMAFAKMVRHPGTKPQPYMVPGAKRALEDAGIKPIIDAWNKGA